MSYFLATHATFGKSRRRSDLSLYIFIWSCLAVAYNVAWKHYVEVVANVCTFLIGLPVKFDSGPLLLVAL